MPAEITTFLFAMTPVVELRGALPWGATLGGLSLTESFFWSVAGNIFVSVLIVLLLPFFTNFVAKYWPWGNRILQKIFAKTRAKHSQNFARFEKIFLVVLVAIPLPGSGGWTGALVAWLFGVEKKWAIFLISLGIILSGLAVLAITTGSLKLFGSF
ncbi:MAG: small multi-drug export protein [Patescibacteria group bacterium]